MRDLITHLAIMSPP